ncbi:MAG: hypothetical protein ABI832_22855 [bacterium]
MTAHPRLMALLAVVAVLALIIGANWRFAHLAFTSHPGCASIDPDLPAASPDC